MFITEAFEHMLRHKWLVLNPRRRAMWKHRYKRGEISLEKMKTILRKNGYRVIHPEVWTKP